MEVFPKEISGAIILEHQTAELMAAQKAVGWPFDTRKALDLEDKLLTRLEELRGQAQKLCAFVPKLEFEENPKDPENPKWTSKTWTPKRDNKTLGYVAGCPMTRLFDFNPSSRDHISWLLIRRKGNKPSKRTPTGKAVIDEVVLQDIGTPEALLFRDILVVQKKLGMLSQGNNAWLKLVKNGRLHHSCFIGAATHRMAHSHPNLAQVSSDTDCRELFITKPGWKLVDSDLAGIELRMFAHYLSRYDGGRYAKVLLNGDIHQENADKIGVTRSQVKTISYAFLYGAGDQKLGYSYDPQLSKEKAQKKGADIRQAYMDAIPGLETLVEKVYQASERGFLYGLDDRRIRVDKRHKSLNFLLQSAAAIVAKRWLLITDSWLYCIKHERYAFVHDEQVIGAPPSSADEVARACKHSALETGEYYKLRLPIEADANIGLNWAEVH